MQFRIGSHLLEAEVQHEERLSNGCRRAVVAFDVVGDEAHASIAELLTAATEGHSRTEGSLVSEDDGGSLVRWELADAAFAVEAAPPAIYRYLWTLNEVPA